MEIKWDKNWRRIYSIFTIPAEQDKVILLHPTRPWSFKCENGETQEELRQKIAKLIAGKGAGKTTEEILEKFRFKRAGFKV